MLRWWLALGAGLITCLTVLLLLVLHIARDFSYVGQEIAFLGFNYGEVNIYRYDIPRGALLTLPDTGLSPSSLAWSPDGQLLVMTTGNSGRRIHTVDINTGVTHRLLATGERDQEPVYSPNGERIIFTSSANNQPIAQVPVVYMMDADGSRAQVVADGMVISHAVRWLDDDQLVFINSRSYPITITRLDLRSQEQITLFVSEDVRLDALDASRDGRVVVYSSQDFRYAVIHSNLYLLDVGTGTTRQLTQGFYLDSYPAIAPDGKRVLFVSDRYSRGLYGLVLMNLHGGEPKRLPLPNMEFISHPVWRP